MKEIEPEMNEEVSLQCLQVFSDQLFNLVILKLAIILEKIRKVTGREGIPFCFDESRFDVRFKPR